MGDHGPVVAVVGRPNVGKSTLVNRLLGRRETIVEAQSGVTRDRKAVEVEWQGRHFTVVDTGGWMRSGDALDQQVSDQSERAIRDADAVVIVVDGTVGLTDEDEAVARLVQRTETPAFVAVNKIDHSSRDNDVWEFLSLGLGDPFAISALHGLGTGDLLDAVSAVLPEAPCAEIAEDPSGALDAGSPAEGPDSADRVLGVALVGRPNVGKSTLFNRLIGDERSVVHDRPGTTRDAIDTIVETPMGAIRFVDTAGMRRRAKVDEGTEYYSLLRALDAVDAADIALLVIDSTVGVTAQDQRLAERIDAAGCPIVVVLNKWDMVDDEQKADLQKQLGRRLHFIGDSTVLPLSALTGKGTQRLIPALEDAVTAYRVRVPTRAVNDVIRRAQAAHPAPGGGRVLYATQGATDPPTFTLFANRTLHETYLRYLERSLREAFDLGKTPIKLRVRRRSD